MPDFTGLGNGLIDIFLLLVILVVLVVIHELGHFLVARRAGVTVHEFGVGFPPRVKILRRDKHGTIYTLNALPIGGFVRLEGEEGESDDPRSFVRQRLPTRLAILLAGVFMNFVLAFVIFVGIAWLADPTIVARIGGIDPGSPAEAAGLRGGIVTGTDPDGNPIYDASGDLIVAIDGRRFAVFDDPTAAFPHSAYLRSRAGQSVTLGLRRVDGTEYTATTTLRSGSDAETRGALGVRFSSAFTETITREPVEALAIGARRTLDAATLILRALGDFVTNLANPQVSGPVGIVSAIGVVRNEAPVFLLWFVGLLSANLAVVNALPIPPLDGGRVAVSLVRALVGERRISLAAERAVYLVGFILLMALLAWVTLFDTGILQRTGT